MISLVLPSLRTLSVFTWTLIWSAIGIFAMILDPTGHLYSFIARKGWASSTLWISGIRVTVRGGEEIDWKMPYVICSNHQSQADIPLLFANLPIGIRFLAKKSLFFIPIFGWMMFIAGFVPVDRYRKQRAHQSIMRSVRRIRRGPALLVFPEGTRSPDGQVHPFKSGAFVMAIHAEVPILPVAIRGTHQMMSKDRLDVRPGSAELVIGNPIPTADLVVSDKERLRREIHRIVESMHEAGEPV